VGVAALIDLLSLAFFGRTFWTADESIHKAIQSTPGAPELHDDIRVDVVVNMAPQLIVSKIVRLARMIHPHLEAGE
jgi:hypothetical protein